MNSMWAATSVLLIGLSGCDNGGGAGVAADYQSPDTTDSGTDRVSDLPPVSLTPDNYENVAAMALQTLLISDSSLTAVERAVNTTVPQSSRIINIASGVVVNLDSLACQSGGSYSLNGKLENSNNNVFIDFNNVLKLSVVSDFKDCDQGSTWLDGIFRVNFEGMIADLATPNMYDFSATVIAENLVIEQEGYYPYIMDSELSYKTSSEDGRVVMTEIASNSGTSTLYSGTVPEVPDRVEQFSFIKIVDLDTQDYRYRFDGRFERNVDGEEAMVEFSTVSPLTGKGYGWPTDGSIGIYGDSEIATVSVEDDGTLTIQLFSITDGEIIDTVSRTWAELINTSIKKVQEL